MGDSPSDDDQDVEDVRLLFSGDAKQRDKALQRLYARHRHPLLRRLIWKCASKEKAEDALQQAFVNIYQSASRPGSTVPTYFGPYLWRIAYNLLLDSSDSKRNIAADEAQVERLAAPPSSAPDAVHPLAYQECLHAALQDLSRTEPLRAEALRLVHLDGWPIEKAAEFLGRTSGATRTFLYTSRPKFKPFAERCWELLQRLRVAEEHPPGPGEGDDADSSGGHAHE